jgi:hypothetical protein
VKERVCVREKSELIGRNGGVELNGSGVEKTGREWRGSVGEDRMGVEVE